MAGGAQAEVEHVVWRATARWTSAALRVPQVAHCRHAYGSWSSRTVIRPQFPPPDDGDLSLVLHRAESSIAEEFEITQRLDSKARAQISSAGAWLAISIGITGAALTRSKPIDRPYVVAVIVLAVLAIALLCVTAFYTWSVWQLRKEDSIAPAALIEMAAIGRKSEEDLAEKLVEHYAATLASRRGTNKTRADAFHRATPWWGATLAVTLMELVAVLVAVAFG